MSKDLFRLALEDEAAAEPSVVLKGPLAEIYASALNMAYAKADPVTGEVQEQATMESQANDAIMLQALAASLADPEQAPEAHLTVYGVSASGVDNETVVDLTQQLAKTNGPDFHLIIDATQPGANSETAGNPTERLVVLGAAAESEALIPVSPTSPMSEPVAAPLAEVSPAPVATPGADTTDDGTIAQVAAITAAMECMVQSHGGRVYRSLQEFASRPR